MLSGGRASELNVEGTGFQALVSQAKGLHQGYVITNTELTEKGKVQEWKWNRGLRKAYPKSSVVGVWCVAPDNPCLSHLYFSDFDHVCCVPQMKALLLSANWLN